MLLTGALLIGSCAKKEPELLVLTSEFAFPAQTEKGVALQFQNTSQNATRYEWDFGDGSTSTDFSPSHTYAATGTYTVTLRAFGIQANPTVLTRSIVVSKYDVFAHTAGYIAGTYDCTAYKDVSRSTPSGTTNTTRMRDTVLTVIKAGPDSLYVNTREGYYTPATGTTRQFRINDGNYAVAYFNTSTDQLDYTMSTSSVGQVLTTFRYSGRRRQ